MRADRRDPIIASLRRFKPHRFEVKLRDGATKTVPLSTKANRWELLSDTLNVLPWVTIEALDEQGSTLGAIERDGDVEVDADPEIERAEAITRIMLSAVSTAMQETRKMFADTMKANAEMCKAMLESQHVVVESYQLALKVQASTMLSQAPDSEGDDKLMEMFKMAMMLRAGGSPTIAVSPPPPKAPVSAQAKPVTNGKG
jgi:hypothetical protein